MFASSPAPNRTETATRGKLKIFLGYAAGVGKTYQMLLEAQALKARGVDIAIGYFESHGRKETIAQAEGLELVPRRRLVHREMSFEEMDTDAILRRHPNVCVVDEFAHTNVPGSARAKRWEDVEILRKAGIDVLSSLNVQHLESLNDQVFHVTGIRVRETVPDWVLQSADEIIAVDVTPRALLHRLERGVIYEPEKARLALDRFFVESNLIALRELALRQTAHYVEEQREEHNSIAPPTPSSYSSSEQILLWLTDDPRTAMLIRRGRRVADFLHAGCIAVLVTQLLDSSESRHAQDRHVNFARNLQIPTETLQSDNPPYAVAAYARQQSVKQILVNRHTPRLSDLVRRAKSIEVTIVAERLR